MRRILKFAIAASAAATSLVQAAPVSRSGLVPAREIVSVWNLSSQSCNGGGANAHTRSPSEAKVKIEKQIELPELGFNFTVPQFPGVKETVLKVRLNDRSRGVTDHYLLLADYELEAPFAAVVITELPAGMVSPDSAFGAARTLQQALSRKAGIASDLSEIDGPYGRSLEMLVPGRVGTHCFPTSDFVTAPPGVETMGITRFVFVKDRLVEFSAIVRVEADMSIRDREAHAQSVMDGFWLSLAPI